MVNLFWRIVVSEPKSEPVSAEASSVSTGPAASDAAAGSAQAPAAVESPGIAPNQEETAPKTDVTAEAPKVEPKFEAPEVKAEAPKAEAKASEAPRIPGNVTIMSPGDRKGAGARIEAEPASGKRRASAMAAVVALATVAGAIGGALATAGFAKLSANETASIRNVGFESSIARLDADILALKASVEQNAKAATGQLNKTSDRL